MYLQEILINNGSNITYLDVTDMIEIGEMEFSENITTRWTLMVGDIFDLK